MADLIASADSTAVLLVNYGGPQRAEDCEPYIRNIFKDPDLIPLPSLLRPLISRAAARRRAPYLVGNYEAMGRFSPILEETQAQAGALQSVLGEAYRCYVGMRYWEPLIEDTCRRIIEAGHRRLVLLPLYPQESRTTTGSAVAETERSLKSRGWRGEFAVVRSFFDQEGFLESMSAALREDLKEAGEGTRILFTAHGLPLSVARKDPYPGQVAETVRLLCGRLSLRLDPIHLPDMPEPVTSGCEGEDFDSAIAWQSKVGPMKWLEPSVESMIKRWGGEGVKHLVLVPVTFVSEHSETLYELDLFYGGIAREAGMTFVRIPTVRCSPAFIEGLAEKVREAFGTSENGPSTEEHGHGKA